MSVNSPNKVFRQKNGQATEDPANITNLAYNEQSGGVKNLIAGPHLKPLKSDTPTPTTDATTIASLRKGSMVAVFNKSASTVYSVKFTDNALAIASAAGIVDGDGNVGIPCAPLEWTYLSNYNKQYVISENANLVVFLIDDDSYISNLRRG